MKTAPQTPLLLTQEQIDAAVSPETLALYYTLLNAGVFPEDESRGTLALYTEIESEIAGALTQHAPTLHELTHVLSDASTALAAESFAEGFRRGVAFTRWLAARSDRAALAAVA